MSEDNSSVASDVVIKSVPPGEDLPVAPDIPPVISPDGEMTCGLRERVHEVTTTTKTVTTTVTELIETETIEYEVQDSSMQTAEEREDHREPLDPVSEITHLKIPFETFKKDFLFISDNRPSVLEAAKNLFHDQDLMDRVDAYFKALRAVRLNGHNAAPDYQRDFLEICNYIIQHAHEKGLLLRYFHNVQYGRRRDPHDPVPYRCMGVIGPKPTRDAFEWRNAILLMDIQGQRDRTHDPDDSMDEQSVEETSSDDGEDDSEEDDRDSEGQAKPKESATRGKRRRSDGSESDSSDKPDRKRRRARSPNQTPSTPAVPLFTRRVFAEDNGLPTTETDDLLSSFALEALSELGNRRHVLGMAVNGARIQFRYFDRSGSVTTHSIHLFNDMEDLIIALISISLCNWMQLGLEPLFEPSYTPEVPFGTIKNCPLFVEGSEFRLHRVLHGTRALYGPAIFLYRATVAKIAPDKVEGHLPIGTSVTIKITWPLVARDWDPSFYRRAERKKVLNLPEFWGTRVSRPLSETYRETITPQRLYQDRVLRLQVLSGSYSPLYLARDYGVFQKAFRMIVNVHHSLYMDAHIIHRNINLNNLMVEETESVKGLIVDMSHASMTKPDGTADYEPPPDGTPAFLAIDLLEKRSSKAYLYRHDLESLFYVLCWILARYRYGEETYGRQFVEWVSSTSKMQAAHKRAFLSNVRILAGTSLVQAWIEPLAKLFEEGYAAKKKAGVGKEKFDDETLGGHVTYEKFMEIVNVEVRS